MSLCEEDSEQEAGRSSSNDYDLSFGQLQLINRTVPLVKPQHAFSNGGLLSVTAMAVRMSNVEGSRHYSSNGTREICESNMTVRGIG